MFLLKNLVNDTKFSLKVLAFREILKNVPIIYIDKNPDVEINTDGLGCFKYYYYYFNNYYSKLLSDNLDYINIYIT